LRTKGFSKSEVEGMSIEEFIARIGTCMRIDNPNFNMDEFLDRSRYFKKNPEAEKKYFERNKNRKKK
jgi:tRNA(Phe) wybutosine-synthesizing methylase Tyw3